MNEKEKMLKGLIYDPSDNELTKEREQAHNLSLEYNLLKDRETEKKSEILNKLLGKVGKNLYIQGPIQFDYGKNIYFGDNCYVNFNFTVLDTCEVRIGNDVFFGPNVSLLTPLHPLLSQERKLRTRDNGELYDLEYGKPITIEDGCWIASNVIVLPGVTIGKNSVIGAGSVVTKDIPDNSLAAGNPCKVIRKITDKDKIL